MVVGGIIPDDDARALRALGVAAVFTPKDFGLTGIMSSFVDVIRDAHALPRPANRQVLRPESPGMAV